MVAELNQIQDAEELSDRFYCHLKFETGGVRGKMGAGCNRINEYTIRKITMGLVLYMKAHGLASVAIAYDTRNGSQRFADEVAGVVAKQEMQVFLYDTPMPTPMLSYAVRHQSADMGIVITASHNPPIYNGYKVYDGQGCQILSNQANEITDYIQQIEDEFAVEGLAQEALGGSPYVTYLPPSVAETYYEALLQMDEKRHSFHAEGVNAVYSPLHGTGYLPVKTVLERAGVALSIVEQQATPDGNFPFAPVPNPEDMSALEMGVEQAQNQGADLVFGTDPDCDRIGVAILTASGTRLLNGNECGVLLFDYLLQVKTGDHKGNKVVKTVVTSDMICKMMEETGMQLEETLTGFKYIGDAIHRMEQTGDTFFFGFEESCGYLASQMVRDKDAVMSALLVCAMVGYWKKQGITLVERLEKLHQRYGYYKETLLSFHFEGQSGKTKMSAIMDLLRQSVKDYPTVAKVEDYNQSTVQYADGTTEQLTLPKSNVLKLHFTSGWIAVRPSGTEPKIKFYVSVHADTAQQSEQLVWNIRRKIEELIESL